MQDFLSGNPISAVDIKYDHLIKLQNEDELIAQLKIDLKSDSQDPKFLKLKENLLLENDVLYHIRRNGKAQIFAPKSIQADILQSAHNSLLGGHMGIFKTSERILDRYFWPSLSHDVEMHIKHCLDCRKTKPHSMHSRPRLKPLPQPGAPNHCIHILVITDSFTKYVELVAIQSKEAKCVADALMDVWFTRYSTPNEVVSDNGKEFCNK